MLVVGGGIYGLTIAYDAAQRGLSVALVERDDFGSGSSFNHLRTIHGGLRYLQSLDLSRARESLRERRTTARIAPHAVRPLRFVLPLERSLTRGPGAMFAGFALDRIVAADRNRRVLASHRLPAGRVMSRREALAQFPGLDARGLVGAAVWYDYVTIEADRLTLAYAIAAAGHGAVMANYVQAAELVASEGRVTGIRAVDALSGGSLDVSARVTVNAAGSAVDHLLEPLGVATRMPMLKAMNLVTRRPAANFAMGGRSASGRNLFLVPWRGRALFGTWESGAACSPDDRRVTRAEVDAFLAELNQAFPSVALTPDDVTLVHRGVVPAVAVNGRVALQGHEQIRDHAKEGVEGLVSVVGAKYTTARGVAERVTDQLLTKLAQPPIASRTATAPLPGGDIDDVARLTAAAWRDLPEAADDTIEHLVAAYGSQYPGIGQLCREHPGRSTRLSPDSPVIAAELVWAVRHEMAMTLRDAVMRRTPLGALGYPGDEVLVRAAAVVGEELGWSAARRDEEAAAVKAFYALAPPTAP